MQRNAVYAVAGSDSVTIAVERRRPVHTHLPAKTDAHLVGLQLMTQSSGSSAYWQERWELYKCAKLVVASASHSALRRQHWTLTINDAGLQIRVSVWAVHGWQRCVSACPVCIASDICADKQLYEGDPTADDAVCTSAGVGSIEVCALLDP